MAERGKNTGGKGRQKPVVVPDMGRLQPQARELEEAVLGALMLEKDAYSIVSEILKPESFYEKAHEKIYAAIVDLAISQRPVDMLTVTEQLKKRGELEEVGGPFYISQLTSKVASSAHIEYHARIIAQKYLARELISFTAMIQGKAFDESIDVEDLMQEAEGKLFEISQRNVKKDVTQINPVIKEAMVMLEKAANQKEGLSGLRTGFEGLDKMTSGWQNSDLIIIAARPAMGKTAFVLSMARNMAVKHHQAVAIFSLEMSAVQLVNRLIASETELSAEKLKTGRLTDEEWQQLHSRIKALVEAPILVDDTPALSIFELRAKCRRLKQKYGIKVLIIDYLQLMTAGADMRGNREQEVSLISRQLKIIAKELSIPVMALSQLNRGVESRPDKKPMLSDLRESGSIEQDADMVMFIHRPEKYGITVDNEGNSLLGIATIIIAKHRSGAVGEVNLRFRAELTQFCDLDTTSPFASSTSTGEIVTQTFSSKMNDEPVPALDQGFEGMRDSFDNNAPF